MACPPPLYSRPSSRSHLSVWGSSWVLLAASRPLSVHPSIHTHLYTPTHTSAHTSASIHPSIHTHIHTHTHTHPSTHTHTHTHFTTCRLAHSPSPQQQHSRGVTHAHPPICHCPFLQPLMNIGEPLVCPRHDGHGKVVSALPGPRKPDPSAHV